MLKFIIKKNYFQDALRLMRISKSMSEKEGVKKAVAVMATDKAKFALKDAGLVTDDINAAAGADLVMVVEADSEDAAASVLSEMETAVTASSSKTGKVSDILGQEMRVINIGLDIFKEALDAQGVKTIQVDWEVPAKGDEKVLEILKKMY
ncbi:MAG: hypothetical protein KC473_10440 [Candidatus Dadabacteria bacterium]|nr:hypothetical protein [Candidatus Dadabacteria bacterium]